MDPQNTSRIALIPLTALRTKIFLRTEFGGIVIGKRRGDEINF